MTTTVQLKAMREEDGVMVPAYTLAEATVFAVYLGGPGAYTWLADFALPTEAERLARTLIKANPAWQLDAVQFKAVLHPPPPPPVKPEAQPEGRLQWVIMAGNPVEGFALYGPYSDRDDAIHAGENGHLEDWWIAELEPVGVLA